MKDVPIASVLSRAGLEDANANLAFAGEQARLAIADLGLE